MYKNNVYFVTAHKCYLRMHNNGRIIVSSAHALCNSNPDDDSLLRIAAVLSPVILNDIVHNFIKI